MDGAESVGRCISTSVLSPPPFLYTSETLVWASPHLCPPIEVSSHRETQIRNSLYSIPVNSKYSLTFLNLGMALVMRITQKF